MPRKSARRAKRRAKILHVDRDRNAYDAVAKVLAGIADVVSVDSIDDARYAVSSIDFDLVVLEAQLIAEFDSDPAVAFRDGKGNVVQVVILSATATEPAAPWPTLDDLPSIVRVRLSRTSGS
ncbi:MAG TPA: hypothetical protein VEK75_01445 [Xanthobacteraceae bacterium]|nr:hypothetical protein [Xanthobacteraceae bacterium]